MTAPENNQRFLTVIPNQESLCTVSDFFDDCVAEFEVPMKLGFKLKIVVDEIYSNIVYYSGAKTAGVGFVSGGDTFTLSFTDDGRAYNPLETKEPDVTASLEDRDIGGLGLYMVKKMAQDVRYFYADGSNQLIVVMAKENTQKKPEKEA